MTHEPTYLWRSLKGAVHSMRSIHSWQTMTGGIVHAIGVVHKQRVCGSVFGCGACSKKVGQKVLLADFCKNEIGKVAN